MAYETILYDVAAGVATITLNRPDSYNALTTQMYRDLLDALKQVKRDKGVRAVVITGAGKGFCSGADLTEVQGQLGQDLAIGDVLRSGLNRIAMSIHQLEKPVICAVNGVAAGAGTGLALACDMRIVSENSSFVFAAFVNIGLMPDAGATYFLPRLVGAAKAFELCVLADGQNRVTAQQAVELGIANQQVSHDDLMNETQAIAQKMATMASKAIGLTKRAMAKSLNQTLAEQLETEAQLQTIASHTSDFQEGVLAFIEKREANFKGE
ncbi:MAG: enoyl-CoA hydratase-related protein [Anaerolineae bacterium]|nr:enoyl-CoA hydratase-related protein [Anaerolineae bacterium]